MKNNKNIKNNFSPEDFNRFNTEEKIKTIASAWLPPKGKSNELILQNILNAEKKPNKILRFSSSQVLKIAASITLLLLTFFYFEKQADKNIEKTALAEHQSILLPDGTKVELNADSKLQWSKKEFNAERKLFLSGEAFFEVVKGSKFSVQTKNGEVNVLGTQFNVFSRNRTFQVACVEGKVEIVAQNNSEIIGKGEKINLNEGKLEKSVSSQIEKTVAWKNGNFYFENVPLSGIFNELERQFAVSIQLNGNGNRLATAIFSNRKLSEALDLVCIPMNLTYEIKGEKIKIMEQKE